MLSMRRDIKTGIALVSLSCCRFSQGFLHPAPHHLINKTRFQQQRQERGPSSSLTLTLPWPLNKVTGIELPWTQKKNEKEVIAVDMPSAGDDRHFPSAKRNRYFIAAELSKWLRGEPGGTKNTNGGNLIEIASGTGCHVEAFAKDLPDWTFQPTEYNEERIPDILATIQDGDATNILPPLTLDVCSHPSTWPRPKVQAEEGDSAGLWDAVLCCNMIHIAPKECTGGLLGGATAGLKIGGHVFIYGPFVLNGLLIPDSNKAFDESLKARSEGLWGIRDAAWVTDMADEHGLELTAMTAMPANNFFVVFTKVRERAAAGDGTSGDARASRVAESVSAIVMPARKALIANLAANI